MVFATLLRHVAACADGSPGRAPMHHQLGLTNVVLVFLLLVVVIAARGSWGVGLVASPTANIAQQQRASNRGTRHAAAGGGRACRPGGQAARAAPPPGRPTGALRSLVEDLPDAGLAAPSTLEGAAPWCAAAWRLEGLDANRVLFFLTPGTCVRRSGPEFQHSGRRRSPDARSVPDCTCAGLCNAHRSRATVVRVMRLPSLPGAPVTATPQVRTWGRSAAALQLWGATPDTCTANPDGTSIVRN